MGPARRSSLGRDDHASSCNEILKTSVPKTDLQTEITCGVIGQISQAPTLFPIHTRAFSP
jgi:hypothetical protein